MESGRQMGQKRRFGVSYVGGSKIGSGRVWKERRRGPRKVP